MKDLSPILSTLRRHKTAATLIVLEAALSCAILCNALHLIQQRFQTLDYVSGLAESELIVLDASGRGPNDSVDEITTRDLQALRALPGVKSVALASQYSFGPISGYSSVGRHAERDDSWGTVASYDLSEDGLKATGLKLVEGRDFLPSEFRLQSALREGSGESVRQTIISKALAEHLYPGRSAVGQGLYNGDDEPITIVGVVERLDGTQPGRASDGGADHYATISPIRRPYTSGTYLVRVDSGMRDATLKAARKVLETNGPLRVIRKASTLEDMRQAYFAQDRVMVWQLVGVSALMLLITALGIVGLASFWVQQRTRMIGTRRALGATRGQILRYFQTENLILTTVGIALGMASAYALNAVLMRAYELPPLPWTYLPAGALALWLLGQLAVLAPARRAAALPPVAALRS